MLFKKEYEVRSNETDADSRLHYHHLASYLQDAANHYCSEVGIAVSDLRKDNLTWVLIGFSVRFMSTLPSLGDKVLVETWPRNKSGIKLLRDYRAVDTSGQTIALANSVWTVIDLKKRRPAVLSGLEEKVEIVGEEALPGQKPGCGNKAYPDRPADFSIKSRVNSFEIDFNGHYSNIYYIASAMEALPVDFRSTHSLKQINLDFRKECFLGDKIISEAWRTESSYSHTLTRQDDGELLCRAETIWL